MDISQNSSWAICVSAMKCRAERNEWYCNHSILASARSYEEQSSSPILQAYKVAVSAWKHSQQGRSAFVSFSKSNYSTNNSFLYTTWYRYLLVATNARRCRHLYFTTSRDPSIEVVHFLISFQQLNSFINNKTTIT